MAIGYLGIESTPENWAKFDVLFKCKRCGQCCLSIGKITLTLDEQKRFGVESLKSPCIYYKDGCTIYQDRPRVCREFPLNKTYPQNEKFWMTVGMNCEGGKEFGEKYAVMVVT